ncbi:MAG: hypothetical protein KC535_05220 [Nanoarchaeota archaeon]|nr:hypothetical protein [Nanoarchaeota archaeon]
MAILSDSVEELLDELHRQTDKHPEKNLSLRPVIPYLSGKADVLQVTSAYHENGALFVSGISCDSAHNVSYGQVYHQRLSSAQEDTLKNKLVGVIVENNLLLHPNNLW